MTTTAQPNPPATTSEHGYRCVFTRIGRTHNVPPLDLPGITEPDGEQLLTAVLAYARPRLLSSDAEVAVCGDELRGVILVRGGRNAGEFTIEPLEVSP